MKIVVAGASGNLGLALTQSLLADGHAVVAIDANIQRLEPFRDRLTGLHSLDLRLADSLQEIMPDVDLVITTVGIGRPKKLTDYQQVDYQANLNLLNRLNPRVSNDLSIPRWCMPILTLQFRCSRQNMRLRWSYRKAVCNGSSSAPADISRISGAPLCCRHKKVALP